MGFTRIRADSIRSATSTRDSYEWTVVEGSERGMARSDVASRATRHALDHRPHTRPSRDAESSCTAFLHLVALAVVKADGIEIYNQEYAASFASARAGPHPLHRGLIRTHGNPRCT
jgi:hypothetical protein